MTVVLVASKEVFTGRHLNKNMHIWYLGLCLCFFACAVSAVDTLCECNEWETDPEPLCVLSNIPESYCTARSGNFSLLSLPQHGTSCSTTSLPACQAIEKAVIDGQVDKDAMFNCLSVSSGSQCILFFEELGCVDNQYNSGRCTCESDPRLSKGLCYKPGDLCFKHSVKVSDESAGSAKFSCESVQNYGCSFDETSTLCKCTDASKGCIPHLFVPSKPTTCVCDQEDPSLNCHLYAVHGTFATKQQCTGVQGCDYVAAKASSDPSCQCYSLQQCMNVEALLTPRADFLPCLNEVDLAQCNSTTTATGCIASSKTNKCECAQADLCTPAQDVCPSADGNPEQCASRVAYGCVTNEGTNECQCKDMEKGCHPAPGVVIGDPHDASPASSDAEMEKKKEMPWYLKLAYALTAVVFLFILGFCLYKGWLQCLCNFFLQCFCEQKKEEAGYRLHNQP